MSDLFGVKDWSATRIITLPPTLPSPPTNVKKDYSEIEKFALAHPGELVRAREQRGAAYVFGRVIGFAVWVGASDNRQERLIIEPLSERLGWELFSAVQLNRNYNQWLKITCLLVPDAERGYFATEWELAEASATSGRKLDFDF